MRRWAWLLVLPLLAAKGAFRDPESLMRQGDDAFHAGQPARAAELYDRAGLRTTEPARAAFNLATARYRQARENLTALAEAEVNYRACLQSDEYRARAHFGLGNCLLIRATGATLDCALLRAAIDRFGASMSDPGCDDALRTDAKYNRAKARLLLLQAPPSESKQNDEPPGDEPRDKEDSPRPKPKDKDKSSPGNGDLKPTPGNATGKGTEHPEGKKDGQQTPGRGALIQPPDEKDAPPLPQDDAALHVEMAARRILADLATHRRGKVRQTGVGGKDW